jgi:hypothetical protein
MKLLLFISFVTFIAISCKKENRPANTTAVSSFSFGTYAGICPAGCHNMFNLSNNQLFEDSSSNNFLSPILFSLVPMSQAKYLVAKPLQDSFPAYLEARPNTTMGCPDCHDQGRIYIERMANGIKQTWNIDTDEDAVPAAIKNYVINVKVVIDQL